MKLTTQRLKRLIREELEKINEADNHQNEIEAIIQKEIQPGGKLDTSDERLDEPTKKRYGQHIQNISQIISSNARPTEKIQQIIQILQRLPVEPKNAIAALGDLYDNYM